MDHAPGVRRDLAAAASKAVSLALSSLQHHTEAGPMPHVLLTVNASVELLQALLQSLPTALRAQGAALQAHLAALAAQASDSSTRIAALTCLVHTPAITSACHMVVAVPAC